MSDEDMVDQRQFGQRQLAHPGAGIDQYVLIDQKRGRSMLLSADAAGAAQYGQADGCLPTYVRATTPSWRAEKTTESAAEFRVPAMAFMLHFRGESGR